MIYFTFLLDRKNFLDTIFPIIPSSEEGDHKPLFDLAKQILDSDPGLWMILDSLQMGYSFNDESEELDPNSLLMKVLVKHLEPIRESADAWRFVELVLPALGWTETDTRLLIYGRSLCSLILPEKVEYTPKKFRTTLDDHRLGISPWCRGHAGWLDLEAIRRFLQRLIQQENELKRISKDLPDSVKNEFRNFTGYSDGWLSDKLVFSRKFFIDVFEACIDVDKPLVMTIA